MGAFKGRILHILPGSKRYGRDGSFPVYISILIATILSISGLCVAESLQYCQEYPLATADWSDNVSLQKFDSSLGKLTGAQISMNLTLVHDFNASNRRDLPVNASIASGANLSIQLPDKNSLVVKSSKKWIIALGPKKEKSLHESDEQFERFSLEPNQLKNFVGSSPDDRLNLPVDVTTVVSLNSDGASGFNTSTLAGASICLTYEYIPADTGISEISSNNVPAKSNGKANL